MIISSVGIFYFLEGLILLGASFKLSGSYRKTRNTITKNFSFLFSFLTLTFFSWSLPSLLAPGNGFLLNIGSLLGEVFIFTGFAFGMRAFVATRFPRIPLNPISFTVILIGAFILYLNATIFGSSQLNPRGIIEWHLHPMAVAIYAMMIMFLTIPLGIEFFRMAIIDKETRERSLIFGFSSFLAGAGGVLVIMNIPWQVLLFGHIILFLGIVFIGWAVFLTEKPEKPR